MSLQVKCLLPDCFWVVSKYPFKLLKEMIMKTTVTKSIIIALTLIALSAQSCKDYLDEKLVSGVTANSFYSTVAGLEDAVDATYSFLRQIHSEERAYMLT